MKFGTISALITILLSGCSRETPKEQLDTLNAEYQGAVDYYQNAYNTAETEADADRVFRQLYPNPKYLTRKYLTIARQNEGHPVEAEALAWLAKRAKSDVKREAVQSLFDRHLRSEAVADIALRLRYVFDDPATQQHLDLLLRESPHERVKGHATLALAELHRSVLSRRESVCDRDRLAKLSKHHSPDVIRYWREFTGSRNTVEQLYERVIDEYGNVPTAHGEQSLSERARAALFEMRKLQPGQPVPEISGRDLDGKPLKLSDFRGKVVLLSFWGHW